MSSVLAAQTVLPCDELDPTLAFFTERLGFRVESIYPADKPQTAVLEGHGARVQLERAPGDPGTLRLVCERPAETFGASELRAPNGTAIEIVDADPPLVVPEVVPSFVLSRPDAPDAWSPGRAGMLYRDLIPDRQGGAFIASHIRIPDAGPVPDYVHFHKIRFQMIFCYRGWVRLAYEDQGNPFVLEAGDCVLQPPRIRHRVLESSGGLEVVEIGCPAEHMTFADHGMSLPTADLRPERDFGGQRFVRHQSGRAAWEPFRIGGFECRDLGIGEATGGLAGARVARPGSGAEADSSAWTHGQELLFTFVLSGTMALDRGGESTSLGPADAFVLPRGEAAAYREPSDDLELLEVSLPADVAS